MPYGSPNDQKLGWLLDFSWFFQAYSPKRKLGGSAQVKVPCSLYGASSGVVLVEVSGRFCSGSGSGWFRCSSKKVPLQAGAHWLQGSSFDMVPVKVLEVPVMVPERLGAGRRFWWQCRSCRSTIPPLLLEVPLGRTQKNTFEKDVAIRRNDIHRYEGLWKGM